MLPNNSRRLPQHTAARVRTFFRVAAIVVVSAGATIVASCGGGDSGGITVVDPVVATVTVTAPTATLSPAQTVQLTATARTVEGSVVSGDFTWASSNTAVVTVNSSGLATAVATGTANITAQRGGKSGSVSLAVVVAGGTVTSLTVTLSDATLPIGYLGQATVTARDANNAVIALGSRTITWSSGTTSVATITSAGVIVTAGIGTTQIRASVVEGANTVAGTANIAVAANPDAKATADVTMPGLTFSPTDIVVKQGGTVRFIFPNLDHNVVWNPRITGSPADIGILSNQTISRTFPTVGVFPYVCTLHNGMVGTIVVSP